MVGRPEGRLLHLDTDVIIAKSLRPLFDLDIRGNTVACVCVDKPPEFIAKLNSRLEQKPGTAYFSAGVMLLDIAAWRRDAVTSRALEVALANLLLILTKCTQ